MRWCPTGATAVLRVEESTSADGLVSGTPRETPEWRKPGEEAYADEELLPAGTPVDPAVIGLAAACGHDTLRVRRAPRAALLVFGDELLTGGPARRPVASATRWARRCRRGCGGTAARSARPTWSARWPTRCPRTWRPCARR